MHTQDRGSIAARIASQPIVRSLCALVLLCALIAWPAPARAAGIDPALAAALDQLLEQTIANPSIPGVVLAIAIPGQEAWVGARGLADRDAGISLTPDTRFGIASISKTFVATVAMQLVQEGWLALDQTVEHWLPGLVPRGDRIAVRQLMNHTSGLRDYLDEAFAQRVLADRGRVWAPRDLVAQAVRQPPYFAPGAQGRWHYSNTNYVLLGLIVEQVTHNSLSREVHQRIIDPLGLHQTFFEPDDPVDGAKMHGYEVRRELTGGLNMSFAWGAGNISSTTTDLARFAQALFGGELLRPETLAAMQAFGGVDRAWDDSDLLYGLGVMQDVMRGAQPTMVRGHTGALVGYRTAMWYVPDRGITLVAAINQMTADPDPLIARALDLLYAQGAIS
jgi:D-alanyl-D-alanine carboxypeptidase